MRQAEDFFLFFILFLAAGVIWRLLEIHFYGAVQHRIVDDIMAVLWLGSLYWTYNRGIQTARETL